MAVNDALIQAMRESCGR